MKRTEVVFLMPASALCFPLESKHSPNQALPIPSLECYKNSDRVSSCQRED